MKTLEELLSAWDEGTLGPGELEELKRLLSTREARAQLADEWLLRETIYDTLRSQPDELAATAKGHQPKAAALARGRSTWFPWLVWRELRFTLRWSLVGCALVLVLTTGGLFLYYAKSPAGTLGRIEGSVAVIHRGSVRPGAAGQPLYPDDIVRVGPQGAASLVWKEGTQFELSAATELQLLNPRSGKKFRLIAGNLDAGVAPQQRWRPLRVLTAQAETIVVGTRFSLSVTGATTRLGVLEGAVRFQKLQTTRADTVREVTVRAGEAARASLDFPLNVEFLTGFLSAETWVVPPGTALADSPIAGVQLEPTKAAPAAQGTVVERLRGYVLVPSTGVYRFWVAGFNNQQQAELWLSPDDDPAHKRRIAFTPAATGVSTGQFQPSSPKSRGTSLAQALKADWTRSVSQKSAPQNLVQGRRCYLEVWHTGTGSESLALGWTLPGQSDGSVQMLEAQFLCPFVGKEP